MSWHESARKRSTINCIMRCIAHACACSTSLDPSAWESVGNVWNLILSALFYFFFGRRCCVSIYVCRNYFFLSCAQLVNENYTCEICELKLYGATSKQQKRSVNARLVLAATKYKSSAVAIELRYPTLNAITIYLKKNMNTEGLQFAQF